MTGGALVASDATKSLGGIETFRPGPGMGGCLEMPDTLWIGTEGKDLHCYVPPGERLKSSPGKETH